MTTVVVQETPPQNVELNEATNTTETVEAVEEVIEEITDSAVEIAEIEANRDIQIAETHAAVAVAEIQARTERDEQAWLDLISENNRLKAEAEIQSSQIIQLTETIATLSTPSEPLNSPPVEITEETISTPQYTLEETSEIVTEAIPESVVDVLEAEVPVVEIPKKGPLLKLV